MSARTTPPFRADHVGSLLRPRALLQAREDAAHGAIIAGELRAIEDDAIRDAVRMQEDIGLRSVTDGEFRRASWHMDFIYQIAGVQKADQSHEERVPQRGRRHRVHPVGDPGHRQAGDGSHDLRLRVRVPPRHRHAPATPKLTIPAPSLVHYRGGPAAIDHAVYPDMDEFWEDLGAAYAEEIRRLAGSAAPTCSSTTPAWRTSTTRRSAPRSPGAARTPSTSTRPTSSPSTGHCGTSQPG